MQRKRVGHAPAAPGHKPAPNNANASSTCTHHRTSPFCLPAQTASTGKSKAATCGTSRAMRASGRAVARSSRTHRAERGAACAHSQIHAQTKKTAHAGQSPRCAPSAASWNTRQAQHSGPTSNCRAQVRATLSAAGHWPRHRSGGAIAPKNLHGFISSAAARWIFHHCRSYWVKRLASFKPTSAARTAHTSRAMNGKPHHQL